jgi:uncharacterized membrane protein YfcA
MPTVHAVHAVLAQAENIPPVLSSKWILIFSIGAVIGFLSGMFGKGGSAITTPALQVFAGIAPFSALTSPLPATLPTTLSASFAYSGKNLINKRIVLITTFYGVPATIAGSFASDLAGGQALMILTAIFILILGISFFIGNDGRPTEENNEIVDPALWKTTTVAIAVGGLSGLLANSGGVLLAPLFIRYLRVPVKQALATSLICAAVLAIPGTLAHWYLGHIEWWIVVALSAGAIPFSYLGARFALSLKNLTLERIFGVMLVLFGAYDLVFTLMK